MARQRWPRGVFHERVSERFLDFARKALQAAATPEAAKMLKQELAQQLRGQIDIYRVAAMAMIDDVIDPRDTRAELAKALKRTANKKVERPFSRRENSPV